MEADNAEFSCKTEYSAPVVVPLNRDIIARKDHQGHEASGPFGNVGPS